MGPFSPDLIRLKLGFLRGAGLVVLATGCSIWNQQGVLRFVGGRSGVASTSGGISYPCDLRCWGGFGAQQAEIGGNTFPAGILGLSVCPFGQGGEFLGAAAQHFAA